MQRGSLVGWVVGGYVISAALRMSSEESADRLGPVLAGSVALTRWMAGHLIFVVLGPVLVLGTAGLVAGRSVITQPVTGVLRQREGLGVPARHRAQRGFRVLAGGARPIGDPEQLFTDGVPAR